MPVHSSLPKIEGFQPIPNAVMIPFMEAQSAALAYGFGLNYEYGKRKIRSMSNEEYNSLTSEDITNMSNAHTHIILSQFQLQVPRVMPMQKEIFKQYVEIEKDKVVQNIILAKWIASNAPQLIAEGLAGDDPRGIRTTTTQLPVGTVVNGKVITAYVDGVPQYRDIPKAPTSRRTPPPPKIQTMKFIRIGNRPIWTQHLNKTKTAEQWIHVLLQYRRLLNSEISKKQSAAYNKKTVGSIYMISQLLHKNTGKWY